MVGGIKKLNLNFSELELYTLNQFSELKDGVESMLESLFCGVCGVDLMEAVSSPIEQESQFFVMTPMISLPSFPEFSPLGRIIFPN